MKTMFSVFQYIFTALSSACRSSSQAAGRIQSSSIYVSWEDKPGQKQSTNHLMLVVKLNYCKCTVIIEETLMSIFITPSLLR